eukprot:TRINITY_DN9945_c0_g1_i1.p1 TRINITY_DN9945_c0_g1~~TRINITY_DN9945_c0_g1_i1.p1  ORF type:complete len:133 (+),score=21.55 TRINITY_DN9945_c0_g1_i1:28-399(+)
MSDNKPTRNHNPLNIKWVSTMKLPTGKDAQGFAIYSSDKDGFQAAYANLFDQKRLKMTVDQAICSWSLTDQEVYKKNVHSWTGLHGTEKMSDLKSSQRISLLKAMARQEGFHGDMSAADNVKQ